MQYSNLSNNLDNFVRVVNEWAQEHLKVRLGVEIVDVWHLLSTDNQYWPVLPTITRVDRLVEGVTYRFFVEVFDTAVDRVFTWLAFHSDFVIHEGKIEPVHQSLIMDSFSVLEGHGRYDKGKAEQVKARTSQALDLLVVLCNDRLDINQQSR